MPGVNVSLAHASDVLFTWTVFVYAVAMFGYSVEFAFARIARTRGEQAGGRAEQIGRAAVGLTVVGWLLHIGSVATRGFAVSRVPWGNMYEFITAITCAAVLAFLAVVARYRVYTLGLFVMAPIVLGLGLCATVLYT
ncbi:MAG: hypothetical protein JO079_06660, partial [Frankiaceae bacterium]|nr:hypothetical protein [Frankiaceae bacterium]